MNLYKRVVLGIIRRPFRVLTFFAVIFVVSIIGITGSFLKKCVSYYEDSIIRNVGYAIILNNTSPSISGISDSIVDTIANFPHVVGVNSEITELYEPYDFKNHVEINENGFTSMNEQTSVRLLGNVDTQFYRDFRNENMVLSSGEFPSVQSNEVLISDILSEGNGLELGDTIHVTNSQNEKRIQLVVVGIYNTLLSPLEAFSLAGTNEDIYEQTPYSYLFCDYDFVSNMQGESGDKSSYTFYVDNKQNIDFIYNQIKNLPLDWNNLELYNAPENDFLVNSHAMVVLRDATTFILLGTYFTAFFILLLMSILWMKDHINEIGIYISLGTSKSSVIIHFFLEIVIISVISLLLSSCFGLWFINSFKEQIVNLILGFNALGTVFQEVDTEAISMLYTFRDTFSSSLLFFMVSVLTTLLSSLIIVRYNPRKLFVIQ